MTESGASEANSRHRRRHIAVFLPSLEGGGAERAMTELVNGIVAVGHDVDLVLGRAVGPYVERVDTAVRIIDLGRERVTRALPRLAAYLRRERPDVLLSAMNHANVVAILASKFAGTGTRLVISERASFGGYRRFFRGVKDRLVRVAMRLTYKMADTVTTVAEEMVRELVEGLGLDPTKVCAIPNSVVSEALLAQAQAEPRHSWMRQATPVILSAGRLCPSKDFETLIRAFALLEQPARLLILGEGPERPRLEALTKRLGVDQRVALPGFDPNPFAYMRRAALFVLPSQWEGLPGVLIQAMACGAQVVSTDCPTGPREVLEGGRWGDLVPVGNPRAMADAMAKALVRKEHPPVERRAAYYSVETSVRLYLNVLLPNIAHDLTGGGSGRCVRTNYASRHGRGRERSRRLPR